MIDGSAIDQFQKTRNKLTTILYDLARIAEERSETVIDKNSLKAQLGDRKEQRRPLAEMLRERAENVRKKNTFRLAVVGEFNAGKSTLVNALLEMYPPNELLTSDWKPTTAARTIIKYDEKQRFRVTYLPETNRPPLIMETDDLGVQIAKFTADPTIGNDEGLLRGTVKSLADEIQEVEVWCRANFLKENELEIIDTPGLGSVYESHKTVTYRLIPEVDATMFLFPGDPGVSENDILFLRYISEYINKVFVVMTKADKERNLKEREDKAVYWKSVIEIKAGVKVPQIYPVSAALRLEGEQDPLKTGFPPIIEKLTEFLVSGGGVSRLEVPLDVARHNWTRLSKNVETERLMLDTSLQNLQRELDRLKQDSIRIEQVKRTLLNEVAGAVTDMIDTALDGAPSLPGTLQTKIQNMVKNLDVRKLLKVQEQIQFVIKETLREWLDGKEKRFTSRANAVMNTVMRELGHIVEQIDQTPNIQSQSVPNIQQVARSNDLIGPAFLNVVGATAARGVLGFIATIGGTGVLLALMSATAIPVVLVLAPLAIPAFLIGKDVLGIADRLKDQIIDTLSKPIPNNRYNLYEGIVYGYRDKEGEHKGVKDILTEAFTKWGEELQEELENTIVNLLDNRMSQVRGLIEAQTSDEWNKAQTLNQNRDHSERLQDIERHLIEVETIVSELRQMANAAAQG